MDTAVKGLIASVVILFVTLAAFGGYYLNTSSLLAEQNRSLSGLSSQVSSLQHVPQTASTFTTTQVSVSTSTETTGFTSTATSTITTTRTTIFGTTVTTTFLLYQGPGQLGTWNRTTSYPFFPAEMSCAANDGYIYCVGGYNGTTPMNGQGDLNRTYYVALSSTGVGAWRRATDYPVGIQDEGCVASSNFIYCVGGYVNSPNGHSIAGVYYAPTSTSGIGPWTPTSPYPYPVFSPRCVTNSGYIYCASSHYNATSSTFTPDLYYAQLSSSGVGSWAASTRPPSLTAGCSASNGYLYCFGGTPCPPRPPPFDCPSPSYYAPLSSGGVGTWTNTTKLPTAGFANYVEANSYEYYFTNPGYYAHLTANGIGQWATLTPYPANAPVACVAEGTYIYCIGGSSNQSSLATNDVYFTRVSP